MSDTNTYTDDNGVIRDRWVDATRLHHLYDEAGVELPAPASPVPYTAAENAGADLRTVNATTAANEATLRERARAAIAANNAWLGRSSAPTNAQTLAHIDRLTKECTALIRLAVRELASTEGTE